MTFDELQLVDAKEFASLAASLQNLAENDLPIIVIAAGLPSLRDKGRIATFLERSTWHEIGLLSKADALLALEKPAIDFKRPFEPDEADHLARVSGDIHILSNFTDMERGYNPISKTKYL
ncbi:MAG: hypothetical protein HKL80_12145 [Acidimicrobiales bacterium]|nr:hypothetical protein [Acidimicrobiales bacterium]